MVGVDRSRSIGDGTTCVEAVKTIKAMIQASDEQSRQLEDLYKTWNEMLKYCVHNYLSQLWRSDKSALYAPLRRQFPRLRAYHTLAAIEIAEGKVRAVRTSIKDGNYKARLQMRWGNDPVQLYYNQTYRIARKGDDLYAKIAYIPRNVIEARLLLTDRDKSLMEEALDGRYDLSGALLLRGKTSGYYTSLSRRRYRFQDGRIVRRS